MSDDTRIIDRFKDIQEEGERLKIVIEETQAKIWEILALPEGGAVTVTFDERGLIADVVIDPDLRKGLSAADLERDINLAILRAANARPVAPVAALDAAGAEALASSPVAVRMMEALQTGVVPEPVEVVNDFKTVTATAQWGNLVSVTCSARWLDTTPVRLIAEEVLRIARAASIESDTSGRLSA
jgi:hypothetical protein